MHVCAASTSDLDTAQMSQMDDPRVIFNGMEMDARMPKILADAQRDRQYRIDGKVYDRIAWGREHDLPDIHGRACPDCGAASGLLHVRGCDMEECPACAAQAIACECDYDRSFGWGE